MDEECHPAVHQRARRAADLATGIFTIGANRFIGYEAFFAVFRIQTVQFLLLEVRDAPEQSCFGVRS
jgi:hypothetical protein